MSLNQLGIPSLSVNTSLECVCDWARNREWKCLREREVDRMREREKRDRKIVKEGEKIERESVLERKKVREIILEKKFEKEK